MTKIVLALAVLCLASAALGAEAKKAKGPVVMTAADLKWADVPNMKGIQFAPAWGNAAKGAHGRFIKFAGPPTTRSTRTPIHCAMSSWPGPSTPARMRAPPRMWGPGPTSRFRAAGSM